MNCARWMPSGIMVAFLWLMVVTSLSSVESAALTLIRVYDGDTITVTDPTVPIPSDETARIRLLYVDTPELKDNAHGAAMAEAVLARDLVRDLIESAEVMTCSYPRDTWSRDRYERLLAVVWVTHDGERCSLQESLIRKGMSVYWQKYGSAPEELHTRLLAAQQAAQSERIGLWATNYQWMVDKANERTAPRSDR